MFCSRKGSPQGHKDHQDENWRVASSTFFVSLVPSWFTFLHSALVLLLVSACAPHVERPGPFVAAPELAEDALRAADGSRLPLRRWAPEGEPKAVLIALHGFNDHGNFFDEPGTYLAARGVLSLAYDQRGFGASPQRGYWAGETAMVEDLRTLIDLVRRRHSGRPLYLLGESMGGAVVLRAMTGERPPEVDGVILSAPAVWGRAFMPWYQRWALWLSAHTVPWMTVNGRGLGIVPSDNLGMLRALGRDPLVIKETRIDAVYGLTDLMDEALGSGARLTVPALILYGEKDQIIPLEPTRRFIETRSAEARSRQKVAVYELGYHMLLRDLQAARVWRDLAAWMVSPEAPLPSGADRRSLGR